MGLQKWLAQRNRLPILKFSTPGPKNRHFILANGNGLALRIEPNGTKLWIFNYYRPYSKKRTSLILGTYPAVTLAESLNRRAEAIGLLAKNIDPKEYKVRILKTG